MFVGMNGDVTGMSGGVTEASTGHDHERFMIIIGS